MPKTSPATLKQKNPLTVRMLCSESYVRATSAIFPLFRGADDYFMALS
jgi:hypothetical protein